MNQVLMPSKLQQTEYKIVAECNNYSIKLALAGFCAAEQAEATLFRYLHNMCLLSDGSLIKTHGLLSSTLAEWQSSLNIPSAQMLRNIGFEETHATLLALCLYRTKVGESEQLINRIFL